MRRYKMPAKEKYLVMNSAAQILGISKQTMSRLIEKGELKDVRYARDRLIDKRDFERFKERDFSERLLKLLGVVIADAIRNKYDYSSRERIRVCGIEKGKWIFHVMTGKTHSAEIRVPLSEIELVHSDDTGYLGVQLNQIERINIPNG